MHTLHSPVPASRPGLNLGLLVARTDELEVVDVLFPNEMSIRLQLPHTDSGQLTFECQEQVAVVQIDGVVSGSVSSHAEDLEQFAVGELEDKQKENIKGEHI